MFVDKEKTFKIVISSSRQIGLYKYLIDNNIKMGDIIDIPWYRLKTSSFRREKIDLICDDCGKTFTSRLQNLDENVNDHFCGSCNQKGEKNYNYGGTIHPNAKRSILKILKSDKNPSKRPEVREKISKSLEGNTNGLGSIHPHSEETKKKLSISVKKAWAEGKFKKIQNTFGQTDTKIYNGIEYQGSYELNFLKYIEKQGYLNKIERGPKIKYINKDGENKIYFSDFRLKNSNIIFEIKSTYILELHKENYYIKESAALLKYDYNLVLDNNFNIVDKKIMEYNERIS